MSLWLCGHRVGHGNSFGSEGTAALAKAVIATSRIESLSYALVEAIMCRYLEMLCDRIGQNDIGAEGIASVAAVLAHSDATLKTLA
jgi:hypothetical protein